jgi:ribosomal protein S1
MVVSVMENLLTKSDNIVVYKAGQTIKGVVIDTNSSRILLDLPGGMTGIITKKEATGFGVSTDSVEKGTTVEALVINPENEQGLVAMSLRRASQENVWAELNVSLEEERIIKVKITEANKGGLIAMYKGIRAFLPVSQLTPLNYPRVDGAEAGAILQKLNEHIGKEFAVRAINVDREGGKLIVSEKAAHAESKKETLKNLNAGDVIEGTVSGVVKFGIFVTFGGVEGLVHLSELDWGHVSNPAKIYSLNDKVEVVVISIDGEKLALSIKRLTDDPWKKKVAEFEEGQEVSGKIVRWNSAGVFIEIKPEVMGTFSLDQFGVESHNDLEITSGEVMTGTIEQVNLDSHRLDLKKV